MHQMKIDYIRQLRRNRMSEDAMFCAFAALLLVFVAIFFLLFDRSFEPTSFQVTSREWRTTSQLYHKETECDTAWNFQTDQMETECETITVIDDEVVYHGRNDDPIRYHSFEHNRRDQHERFTFHSTVRLLVGEDGKVIDYHASEDGYGRFSSGMYCLGEIGWFDHVRRLNCGGR